MIFINIIKRTKQIIGVNSLDVFLEFRCQQLISLVQHKNSYIRCTHQALINQMQYSSFHKWFLTILKDSNISNFKDVSFTRRPDRHLTVFEFCLVLLHRLTANECMRLDRRHATASNRLDDRTYLHGHLTSGRQH